MTDYVHQTADVIDIAAGRLPRSWENVSGLDKASDAELKVLGWLPVVESGRRAFDSETERELPPTGVSVGDPVEADADSVTATYRYQSLTPNDPVQVRKREEQELLTIVKRITDDDTRFALLRIMTFIGIEHNEPTS